MSETRIALQRGRQGQVVLGQRWDRCRWRKIRSAYEALPALVFSRILLGEIFKATWTRSEDDTSPSSSGGYLNHVSDHDPGRINPPLRFDGRARASDESIRP